MKTKLQQKTSKNFKSMNGIFLDSLKSENTFTEKDKVRIVLEGQSGSLTVSEVCNKEHISLSTFHKWTKEVLFFKQETPKKEPLSVGNFSEYHKSQIVIEGKSGETSIDEICKREKISKETFLDWCQDFLQLRKQKLGVSVKDVSQINKNRAFFKSVQKSDVFNYLENFIDFSNPKTIIDASKDNDNLLKINKIGSYIYLGKINDIRYINKYFEDVNEKLPVNGLFAGCLETFTARRERLRIAKFPFLNNFYFAVEFIVKRILPKLSFTKKYYFDITKGNDRLLSKAEGLGRLVSSGFKIMDYKTINGLVYFVVKKEKKPAFDLNPSYGPIYRMPRLGKNGEIIKVYKFRTMHPYSEYLQDYVLKCNGYAETGKPAHDFRIPYWGKVMRKYWLDELPQLINVLKGEMKLVGIRPVSQCYFDDIPKEMQRLRLTQKPGCIPPYVALNRKGNVMSVLQSEKDYLVEKIKNPYTTDIKYFLQAIYNILVKNKRSA